MNATPTTTTAATPAAGYVASLAPATRPGAVAQPHAGREAGRRSRPRRRDRPPVACRDPGTPDGRRGWLVVPAAAAEAIRMREPQGGEIP